MHKLAMKIIELAPNKILFWSQFIAKAETQTESRIVENRKSLNNIGDKQPSDYSKGIYYIKR